MLLLRRRSVGHGHKRKKVSTALWPSCVCQSDYNISLFGATAEVVDDQCRRNSAHARWTRITATTVPRSHTHCASCQLLCQKINILSRGKLRARECERDQLSYPRVRLPLDQSYSFRDRSHFVLGYPTQIHLREEEALKKTFDQGRTWENRILGSGEKVAITLGFFAFSFFIPPCC